MIVPKKCWNHFSNILLLSFCYCFVNSSELSELFTALRSDEFSNQQQNDNKKLLAKQFQYFTKMMITANDWNQSDYQQDSCVSFQQSKQEF